MTVVSFSQAKEAREAPDVNCLDRDDYGRLMARFLTEYTMDGKTYASEIWAYSIEDAEQRVQAMRISLVVLGQAFAER